MNTPESIPPDDKKKKDKLREVHINGRYMIIVALISLMGGYLLRPQVDKYFNEYCSIGGLWRINAAYYCGIHVLDDNTFYIKSQIPSDNSMTIYGEGIFEEGSRDFKFKGEVKEYQDIGMEKISRPISGVISLAGCNQISVTIKLQDGRIETHGFKRDKSSLGTNPDPNSETN